MAHLADKTTVDIDYELRSSQAREELKRVQADLDSVTAKFQHHVQTTKKGIQDLTREVSAYLKQFEAGTLQQARAQQRGNMLIAGRYQDAAQGGTVSSAQQNNLNRAATQAIINDITNSVKASQAKITDAIVRTATQQMRTADEMVAARLRGNQFSNNQTLANNSAQMLAAREWAAEQRRQDQLYAYQNGRAALASKNRMEQLNYNGGSDLMAVQGRVMANYMVVGGLFNTVQQLLSGVVELDKEFHQFQAISTTTNAEMVKFKENLTEIAGTDVPFTLTEMAKASTLLAQAGASASEVIGSIGEVAKFATASGSELAESVDVITSTMTAFNIGTERTGEVANTLTSALNLSKLSVDRLRTSLAYVGPTANEVGLSLQETVSVLGALAQSGIGASTIGTGTRALLVDLQNPSEKLQKTIKALGLSMSDIDVKGKGLVPVIEALSKAGFGSAEAYASLELRAAAAFVALENNIELTYDMQRAFTLSAAATKASETQMKSLSNTAKSLGSVVSSMAYEGFEPLIGILQGAMEATTGLLKFLGQVPGLLQTISIAVAALGTAMAASLGLSLLKSLSGMIPLLGGIGAGFTNVAVALGAAKTAGEGFSFLLTSLGRFMMTNWVGLTITAITVAVGAFIAWRNRTDELTVSIDSLKGRVNELQGAADETGKKVHSVEEAIQGVIDRRKELESNRPAFDAKVDELRMQFVELGLSIRGNVENVTDLIRELNNLKTTSARTEAAQLGASVAAQEELLAALEKKRDQVFKGNSDIYSPVNSATISYANGGRYDASATGNLDYYRQQIGKELGPQIMAAVEFASGKKTDDAAYAVQLGANVEQLISQLRLQDPVANQRQIEFLQQLKDLMQPMIAATTELAAARAEQKVQTTQLASRQVEGTSAAQAFSERFQNFQTNYKDQLGRINESNLTAEQKGAALQELARWFERASSVMLNSFEAEAKKELGPQAETDSVRKALANKINELKASLATGIAGAVEGQIKNLTKDLRSTQTQNNKALSRQSKMVGDAQSEEVLKIAVEGQKKLLDNTTAEVVAIYDRLIALTTDADKKSELLDDKAAFLEDRKEQAEEDARTAAQKSQDLLKQSLERQKIAVQDVAKGIQEEIDRSIIELSKTSPGEAMKALAEKIKALNAALQGELNKVNGINTQIQGINTGTPISPGTAANAQGVISALMQAGLSKNGAAAVAGNLSLESSFNPNAKGDIDPNTGMPTAFGLAQWRGNRWRELTAGTSTPWDTSSQLNFLMKELQRDNPDLFARLQSGGEDPATLAKAFMEQFERPNSNPAINHVQDRMNSAEAFAANSTVATDAQVKENDQRLATTQDQNNAEFLKASNDATIKSLNARLANLKTQVRVNGEAGSLDELKTKIEDAHKEIMEKELASFDAENAKLKEDNLAGFNQQRQDLQAKLQAAMNSDLLKVMDEYYKAAEEALNKPVNAAKAKLEAAQQPDVASKYTPVQIQQMQNDVVTAEREAEAKRVLLLEQQIAEVKARAQAAPAGSAEAEQWITRENELLSQNAALKEKVNATNMALAKSSPTMAQGIQAGTQAWAQQNGILDAAGKMVPLATQVGSAWTDVLGGLSTGFSSFFTNMVSGTMSAGEAVKQLGRDILNMFIQIIAKALANQIIMSLFGGGTASGGIMGSLFGVVGAATGGVVRMANGGSPFRDSKLYSLMPGEYVMRQSAVNAIGVDNLDRINNLGNRRVSEGALGQQKAANDNANAAGAGTVNVWVVSPDQVPPPGPRDIIATVADDINRRGTIKRLIQQVQMGTI